MPGMVVPNALTGNDQRVLDALFDPESSLSQPGAIINDTSTSLPQFTPDQLQALRDVEAEIIRPLNSETPSTQTVHEAISQLDNLISTSPAYSPAYTNRAQARRLLLAERDYTSTSDATVIELILADLSKAITLASPASPSVPVSAFQAQLLSSAHTHRAYLVHMITKSGDLESLPETLRRNGIEPLEDMASHDFYLGGMYGDEKAKQMSVATNPYAKMCGAIVKEAMKDEIGKSVTFN